MPDIDENEEDYVANPDAANVPHWIAGLGTYSVLTVYNKTVQWLFSFLDVPPWAIVVRDILLAGSNVAIGELLGRKMMRGQGVDVAIRLSYTASSIQTIATGIYQAVAKSKGLLPDSSVVDVKRIKTAKQAKHLLESALDKQKRVAQQVDEARAKFLELSDDAPDEQKALPPGKQNGVQNGNGVQAGGVPQLSNRISRRTVKKAILGGLG